jgi:glycosyltransferase involved in cell wall biosynthesis
VLASIFEGSSVALLEAMAAGLAIVTTRAGAAAEILEDGREAALVPPADARALAAAIEALVLDPSRRRTYGERARVRARTFACEQTYPRFFEDFLGTSVGAVAPTAI